MSTTLFEMGKQAPEGPEFDLEAAANFYLAFARNAEAAGMTEEATRLQAMAEVDAKIVEDSVRLGLAPVFMNPHTYPVQGEPSVAVAMLAGMRQLVINPAERQVRWLIQHEVDSEFDVKNQDILHEFDKLVFPAELQGATRMKYIDNRSTGLLMNDPNATSFTEMFPTVADGITIQVQELIFDSSCGVEVRLEGGEFGPKPPSQQRRVEIIAFRPQQDD